MIHELARGETPIDYGGAAAGRRRRRQRGCSAPRVAGPIVLGVCVFIMFGVSFGVARKIRSGEMGGEEPKKDSRDDDDVLEQPVAPACRCVRCH